MLMGTFLTLEIVTLVILKIYFVICGLVMLYYEVEKF